MINLGDVRRLKDAQISKGERWLYSADFNVVPRVDEEAEDIKRISEAGGIVLILAHQGRLKDGSAKTIEPMVQYLREKLGREVLFSKLSTEILLQEPRKLIAGDVVLMENVRLNKGEEKFDSEPTKKYDPELAKKYSRLGSRVVIGGFGKAHRIEGSNVGLLDLIPGWLGTNHEVEMIKIAPWAGSDNETRKIILGPGLERKPYSIAVLGGIKKEKILDGLAGFVETYDYVIPGGIVLNTLLKNQIGDMGKSVIDDGGKTFETETAEILKKHHDKIYIPDRVRILIKDENGVEKCIPADISSLSSRQNFKIVDFYINGKASYFLERTAIEGGRIVLAGTPGMFKQGYSMATTVVLDYMNRPGVRAIALGGDTAKEVRDSGIPIRFETSSGGGSALYFLARGTTPVYDALIINKSRFSDAK